MSPNNQHRGNPYSKYPQTPVPIFELTSQTCNDGSQLPEAQRSGAYGVQGGRDATPQLSWSGFDADKTKSFVVTCYDPDAPNPSGFWHWAAYDLPASCTSLVEGASTKDDNSGMPPGSKTMRNDAGWKG